MQTFSTILFDLDDTLFHFGACWEKGMQYTIRTHSLTADLDENAVLEALRRHGDQLWIDVIARKYDFTQYRQLRLQRALADFQRSIELEEADDFQHMYAQACMDAVEPHAVVQQAVDQLASRFRLGIVTNGPADMAFIKLSRLGLSAYFPDERVFLSERVGYHKPDLRIFQTVLKHLDLKPEEVLFVGDNWEADVAGPIEAGMSAVWINPNGLTAETHHRPLAVIKRVEELLDVVAE